MKQLEIEVIDLVADPHHATDEEEKISSSSSRKQLLGTLLRPPLKVFVAKKVFFLSFICIVKQNTLKCYHSFRIFRNIFAQYANLENVLLLLVLFELFCNSTGCCVIQETTFPYIIGLTGSTASGKSSVCARLERLGAVTIDCDKLGKFILFLSHCCNKCCCNICSYSLYLAIVSANTGLLIKQFSCTAAWWTATQLKLLDSW